MTDWVSKLSAIRKQEAVLNYGSFRSAFLTNKQCVMKRELDGSIIYIAINAEDCEFKAYFNIGNVELKDLITHDMQKTDGSLTMPPYSAQFLKVV